MKTIGIPLHSIGGATCGVSSSYFYYFSEFFEDVQVLFLPPKHVPIQLDLLVLPGGSDVNPIRYGKAPGVYTSNPNIFLEHFDTVHLPVYIQMGTPILGICRGHQTLNVHFGGSLEEINHEANPSNDQGKEMHKVVKSTNAGFERILLSNPENSFGVNSRHHQGFTLKNMSKEFIPLYFSLEKEKKLKDCCIEAFVHMEYPIVGVQWHPEDLCDSFTYEVVTSLLNLEKPELNELSTKNSHEKL